jgi:hypothetical protein
MMIKMIMGTTCLLIPGSDTVIGRRCTLSLVVVASSLMRCINDRSVCQASSSLQWHAESHAAYGTSPDSRPFSRWPRALIHRHRLSTV